MTNNKITKKEVAVSDVYIFFQKSKINIKISK
jgi:hypothetical protein